MDGKLAANTGDVGDTEDAGNATGGTLIHPNLPRVVLLTLAGCFLMATSALAQPRSMSFDRISTEDGLSAATVNAILQDSSGFLWFGTQDGLNRFDGTSTVVYKNRLEDPRSLGNNWIDAMIEDPITGNIWLTTRGGGLNLWRRDSDSFERFVHDPENPASIADNEQRALLIDRDGILWVGTEQTGVDLFDPSTRSFRHLRHDPDDPSSLSHDRIRALYQDSDGRIWVGTSRGGLNLKLPGTQSFRHYRHQPRNGTSINDDSVTAVLEDSFGSLWFATHGGLARYVPASDTFVRYAHDSDNPESISDDRVRALLEDSAGRFWVATDSGLNLLDRDHGVFRHYRYDPADPTSLGNDRVASLYQSLGDVLWVGTQGGGVNKWNPRSWPLANDPIRTPSLSNTDVLSISLGSNDDLWIGTSGGGLNRFDRRTGRTKTYRHKPDNPRSLSEDRVTALLHDYEGVLWVGTLTRGLDRFVPESESFLHYPSDSDNPNSLGASGVMTLFEDREHRLWIGTWDGGLNLLDRSSGTFRHWRHDPEDRTSLGGDRSSALAQGPDGLLWVGDFGGGLDRFDPKTGVAAHFQHDPELNTSLSNDKILSLHFDPRGRLWVGTAVGLNCLECLDQPTGEGVFRRFFVEDGLPNNFIYGVLSDLEGNIWVSTNAGLARVDPETETFRSFDSSHGLQSDEFNQNAYFRAPDGELFFGGIYGYNSFYPDRIDSNSFVPPVVITGFSKVNDPVSFGHPTYDVEEIVLDWRDNVFSLDFAALDYTAPQKNRYRYQLEGFDNTWIDHGTRRRVTFTNLDPGAYTFRVQGSNSDGVWNEQGAAVRIIIPPPFWMTWWFRSVLLSVTLALVGWVFRRRTRSMRRRGEELETLVEERTKELRLAQDRLMRKEKLAVLGELAGSVAHELRNPLGAIKNSTYFLRMTQNKADLKGWKHLELIDNQISRSNRIITELLDFGRSPAPVVTRSSLQTIVREAIDESRIPSTFRVVSDLDGPPVLVDVDPGQINRILVNLIRNAEQAISAKGVIEIRCLRVGGRAVIEVIDNGVGISESDRDLIFEPLFTSKVSGIGLGLPLSQRYAELNAGYIECESVEGQGATFRLWLPLSNAESPPSPDSAASSESVRAVG